MGLNNAEDVNLTDFLYYQHINDELNYDDLFTVYNVLHKLVFILNICGIFENVAICWILVRKKKCFKSFSNFHLLNLAITDIFFRIIFTAYVLTNRMGTGDSKCKVAEFGIYTTLAVTFCLLAGIAFDRYIHIVHPFTARRITWKHSRNLVAVSWIYGAVSSAPFLYSTRGTVNIDGGTVEKMWRCYQVPGLPFQISITAFLGCSFLIPLVFMGFAYGKLLRVLWKRARTKVMNPRVARAKIRAVKMMVLVVLTYFITWGPHLIWQTMDAFPYDHQSMFGEVEYEEDDFNGLISSDELEKLRQVLKKQERKLVTYFLISMILETMTFFSSVLNPLIFGYYNRSFREEVKTILCGNKCMCCLKQCKQVVFPNLGDAH